MDDQTEKPDNWTFNPKETAEPSKPAKTKGDNTIIKYAVVAVVFLVIGIFASSMIGLTGQFVGTVKESSENIGEKVGSYIQENFLGEEELTINEVVEENGLYRINFDIGGVEYDSYASPDGHLLFPTYLDMDEVTEPVDTTEPEPQNIPKTDKPIVELFVMSFCPYGQQAENIMLPVVDALGSYVDIVPQFVLSLNEDGTVRSLHGQYEVDEDARQLCIIQEYGLSKLWEYFEVFNGACSSANLDTCWKEKAEEIGIDVSVIEQCFEEDGSDLLAEQAQFSSVKGVSASPTIIINSVKYTGSRNADAFKDAICSAFTEPPAECSDTLSAEAPENTGSC